MNYDIVSAVVAAVIGLIVAFINYFISERVLVKAPEKYSLVTVVRQILQLGVLAAVYFVGTLLKEVNPAYMLVGAVLGMTLPMIFFTKKLLSVNEKTAKAEKEAETDG